MEIGFTKEMQYEGVTFRYSRSPSLRKGNEIHAHHEIIYYIDGDATLLAGGIRKELEKNTLIFVPKGCFHNIKIKHQNNYIRLTIGFSDIPLLEEVLSHMDEIKLSCRPEVTAFADAIIKDMCGEFFAGKSLAVYASFLSMMSVLSKEQMESIKGREANDVVSQCMAYIDGNFAENIKVSELAKKYYVSESFLFSEFKKSLGISIHKYITQRRMMHAKSLLEEGRRPTEIHSLCGYADYSTFYKAYTKRFRQSPKEAKNK
jgi:AraC-like DNA-binding protein